MWKERGRETGRWSRPSERRERKELLIPKSLRRSLVEKEGEEGLRAACLEKGEGERGGGGGGQTRLLHDVSYLFDGKGGGRGRSQEKQEDKEEVDSNALVILGTNTAATDCSRYSAQVLFS